MRRGGRAAAPPPVKIRVPETISFHPGSCIHYIHCILYSGRDIAEATQILLLLLLLFVVSLVIIIFSYTTADFHRFCVSASAYHHLPIIFRTISYDGYLYTIFCITYYLQVRALDWKTDQRRHVNIVTARFTLFV